MATITARKHDPAGANPSIEIPDSRLCRRITEFVRDTEFGPPVQSFEPSSTASPR